MKDVFTLIRVLHVNCISLQKNHNLSDCLHHACPGNARPHQHLGPQFHFGPRSSSYTSYWWTETN